MTTGYGTGQVSPRSALSGIPSYTHSELHFATEGQQRINLLGSYMPGANDITVYLNGLPVAPDDYREIDTKSIAFHYNLNYNDTVCILYQKPAPAQFLAPQRYTATACLLENQEYHLTINLGEISEFKFTSRYSPLYSSVKVIRSDLGAWLQDFSDDAINYAIYESSKMLIDLLTEAPDPIPNYIKHYIRYKTEINLLTAGYLAEVKGGSLLSKKLGDLTINREQQLPGLSSLMTTLYRNLAPWESRVFGDGERVAPGSAVRAGGTTYTARGTF